MAKEFFNTETQRHRERGAPARPLHGTPNGRARSPSAPHGEGARPHAPQAGRAVAPRPPPLALFADVLSIINGKNQKAVEAKDGRYPIYGSGGVMGRANDWLCDANTVIIGRKGSINNPIYVEEPFWNVDTAFGLVADRAKLLPKYLYYFCVKFDFTKLNTTVTIPSLTKANLLKVQIPLPLLPEQKRIAAILDKICEMKRNAEARLQKLDLLVKARFVEMFDSAESEAWKCKAIEDICCLIADCPHTTAQDEGAGYPLVRTPNIGKGRLVYDKMHYVSEAVYNQRNKRAVPCARDLILAREAPAGNIAVIQQDEKVCLGQRTVLLRPNLAIIDSEYMAYRILSEKVQRTILGYSSGSTVAHLNVREIRKLEIVLPPLALQRQFAAFVEKVEGLKATAKKELEQVDLLYRAKLQEFFG